MTSISCAPTSELTVEQIFEALRDAVDVLPVAALQAVLDRWEEVLPAVIELFDRRDVDGDSEIDPRFFLIHLAGEVGDPRVHAPICRLLLQPESFDKVFDGTVAEDLNGILINTFDGEPASLLSVIEEESANEYARADALSALAYLFVHGRLGDFDMAAYLVGLPTALQPRDFNFVWIGWATTACHLGFRQLLPSIEQAFTNGFIDDYCVELEGMIKRLDFSESHGATVALARDLVEPYGNAIETLADWFRFSPQTPEHESRRNASSSKATAERHGVPVTPSWNNSPATNQFREVGRNDPCPCGSGKKFKKCCARA